MVISGEIPSGDILWNEMEQNIYFTFLPFDGAD